ncbi:MAG: 5-(carboxyamino)imidazole ribonucleotide synthase [Austwickia sp.]|nr:5-(carboxyamino)imidazole ribonucleotide synthase [Austwickia sp.]MBK9100417.1 5-(carboxyamino)imidazole ribonucleotide synthase [Austwickia sp.]
MCQPPAINLSLTLSVLAEAPDASAALVVPSAPVSGHDDLQRVRAFAAACDVVTFDHEHVPAHVLAALEADGVPLHPRPEALVYAQDKLAMRRRLGEIGVACPRWAQVRTAGELAEFAAGGTPSWPVIVKTTRGGYDGKGVRVVTSADAIGELADWFALVEDPQGPFRDGLLAEEFVPFDRELAVLVARSPSGQAAAWPVVETEQRDGVCARVIAPAPGLSAGDCAQLTEIGLRIAGALGVTGVLAVEMFAVTAPGSGTTYLVNELAMRPHNSGHWSIDGSVTSQFEQHLRAVLDLPLGDPRPRAPWSVMVNVFGADHDELYSAYRHVMAADPGLKIHLYGKGVRSGRKIGHVTACGSDVDALRERTAHAADYLAGVIDE